MTNQFRLQIWISAIIITCISRARVVDCSIIRNSDLMLITTRAQTAKKHQTFLPSSFTRSQLAFIPRGGSYDEYDDSYDDEYDDEYDDGPKHTRRPPPSPPPSSRSRSRRPPPSRRPGPRDTHRGHAQSRRRPPQRPPQKPKNEILEQAKNLSQKSLKLATSATTTTLKSGGKAAYYLTAPKFVSRNEVCGVWRFDQSIDSTACAANVEFTPSGDAVTKYHGEENVNGYLFQSRSWPRSCTIEFESEAFQGPEDNGPVRYYYKGSFRRKIADKNVIKIVGKIYEVKKRFGKSSRGVEVGSFVARRRITAADRNRGEKGDEEFEDMYDDYDDYDDDLYDEYDESRD